MSSFTFNLSSREIVALFLLLRSRENELDGSLESLHERLADLLYSRLSIEEMEQLSELYAQKIDVLE